MRVIRYEEKLSESWNNFIERAKNSTFLFNRSFMDYHKDRFQDHSTVVYDDNEKIVACFPANETDDGVIWSHQGLTYGAVCLDEEVKLPVVIEVFDLIINYYKNQGFTEVRYKAFPRFYNRLQTDEIEYCMFLHNASLFRKDTALAIDNANRIKYSGNIRREAKKALKNDVEISESQDFSGFWNKVLGPNLQERFGVKPVHSLDEIEMLRVQFPDKVRLFLAHDAEGKIVAGTVLFVTPIVAHAQYISATDNGRRSGALNLLFTTLIDDYFNDWPFFDFGIANEDNGKKLNDGLLAWKERMGGRSYSHDFYKIDLI